MAERKSTNLHARVAPETAEKLKALAAKLGYVYGGEGSIAQLLDAIASGEIILLSTKNTLELVDTSTNTEYNLDIRVKNVTNPF